MQNFWSLKWTGLNSHDSAFRNLLRQPQSSSRQRASRARPVLVLFIDAINRLQLVVTVVVGTKGSNIRRDHPTNVRVSSEESRLPLETIFLGFQVRSLDPQRFPEAPAGKLSADKMLEIETAVRYCLGL